MPKACARCPTLQVPGDPGEVAYTTTSQYKQWKVTTEYVRVSEKRIQAMKSTFQRIGMKIIQKDLDRI